MAQVAFAANRVDIWWDNNNAVTSSELEVPLAQLQLA